MYLFPQFKDLKHEFIHVDMDEQAQRPIWCIPLQQELLHSLGSINKVLVLDNLWKTYRWPELRDQIDESAQGEHFVLYRQEQSATVAERRLLLSTVKVLQIGRNGENIYNRPFFRQHLCDEDALLENEIQAEIRQFIGVHPENSSRIADILDALGPRIREIIRFTVHPATRRADRAECIFECLWRIFSSLHERGVDFVITMSEMPSAIMRLFEVLGEKLGQALILPVAKSMILNRETGFERETVLYFISTAPFSQLVPSLSINDLEWVLNHWTKRRQQQA